MRELLIDRIVNRLANGLDEMCRFLWKYGQTPEILEMRNFSERVDKEYFGRLPKDKNIFLEEEKENAKKVLRGLTDNQLIDVFRSQCCHEFR